MFDYRCSSLLLMYRIGEDNIKADRKQTIDIFLKYRFLLFPL